MARIPMIGIITDHEIETNADAKVKRNERIALALVEKCKDEGGVTVADLKRIFEIVEESIIF